MKYVITLLGVAALLASGAAGAQPEPQSQPDFQAQAQPEPGSPSRMGRNGQMRGIGGNGRIRQAIGSAEIAPELFEERWTNVMHEPVQQSDLSNQNLRLHLYGDGQYIRKSQHPTENYLYTGEAPNNWALTLSDPDNYWDLSGSGKVMLRTRNSGYRFTHIVIKAADGHYYVSEEGSGPSTSWRNVEYILSDLHWHDLMMHDTPTNASNRRKPDPNREPIVATYPATPDLTKIDEVGFSDLMPGGWIASSTRVNYWIVYGKKVPRG